MCSSDLIIEKLHGVLMKVVNAPDSLARLAANGAFPVMNTPEQFAEENRLEVAKWAVIVKEHAIKAD